MLTYFRVRVGILWPGILRGAIDFIHAAKYTIYKSTIMACPEDPALQFPVTVL